MEDSPQPKAPLTGVQWLICSVAALGFAFDIYQILVWPLMGRDAVTKLTGAAPGTPTFTFWMGCLFYVPALAGGIFGLIGGYLADRFGRRRVLVWSILIYAVSALLAGFSTSVEMLLVLRSATFVGVCVEFVAAVAWLAELFPEPRRREKVLGYTQAFSSTGGLLAAGSSWLIQHFAQHAPPIYGDSSSSSWRYMLISGVIPALPLIIIRPFLPESPVWKRISGEGPRKRPSFLVLFRQEYRRTTIVASILFACSFGAAFGALQQVPQIVPGLPTVKELPKPEQNKIASGVQMWQEIGGLAGRLVLAVLVVRVVSQRKLLRVFQLPGLILIPIVFLFPATSSLSLLKIGIFLAGLCTIGQLSFWGNYLPRVYPTHLRGTGESFAANVGGRMVGTSAAWVATYLASKMPGAEAPARLAQAAALVAFSVYLLGTVVCFWLPEPAREELPE